MEFSPTVIRVYWSTQMESTTISEAVALSGVSGEGYSTTPPAPGRGAVYVGDAASLSSVVATLSAPEGADWAGPIALVALGGAPDEVPEGVICFSIPSHPEPGALAPLLRSAADLLSARIESRRLSSRLFESEERIAALNRIGIALSAERDVEKLLERILTESRKFSRSEAGSLYLSEAGEDGKRLRFKLAQNDAVPFTFTERTVAVDERSLVGHVALHGEPLVLANAYALPPDAPYHHNDSFDVATGWTTRAVLVVPMNDHRGELVGVLQLMNRHGEISGSYEPYPADLVPVMLSLATQAAVCLKANQLTASIRRLFEDFARAAIVAVEQRDPTTAGHSNRVADLTVELARVVDRASDGPYSSVSFSREELREIGTAALLHDFGKISIPERVLVKAKKLEPDELTRIRDRFDFALESGDAIAYRELLRGLVGTRMPTAADLSGLVERRSREEAELESLWGEILTANEPKILPEASGATLRSLRERTFQNRRGAVSPLLLDSEFQFLSIRKGSLSEEERAQIESHVSHTFRFLSNIPWTPDLARVPEIAHSHHEKLDGSGYPQHLRSAAIPVSARLLTICDIYDALTAADRPYKKAVPRELALRILNDEAKEGKLDPWLVGVFIAEQVWLSLEKS